MFSSISRFTYGNYVKTTRLWEKVISLMIAQCLHNDESLATPMSNNGLDSVKFGVFATPSYKLPN